jgi:hypothetical protein
MNHTTERGIDIVTGMLGISVSQNFIKKTEEANLKNFLIKSHSTSKMKK